MFKPTISLLVFVAIALIVPTVSFFAFLETIGSCRYLPQAQRQQPQLAGENPAHGFCVNSADAHRCRPRWHETRLAAQVESSAAEASGRERVAIEASDGVPRGPAGSLKLTYLELNSWMWQANGLNILVDPVFGVLDFGVPALIQARKRVLWDSDRVIKDLAAVTDFVAISQGFDDHCHAPTLRALASFLDPSVGIVAPPSARAVIEEFFDASRVTYLLPGQATVLSKGGRAVEVRATTGAVLGPPWQQAENGYIIRPAAAEGGGSGGEGDEAPEGGSLYFEPHLMFDEAELSQLQADVVIAPGVQQSIGPYTLVAGGSKALDLASLLKSSKVVTMPNAEGDFTGPFGNVVTRGSELRDFLHLARVKKIDVIDPVPAVPLSVWP